MEKTIQYFESHRGAYDNRKKVGTSEVTGHKSQVSRSAFSGDDF